MTFDLLNDMLHSIMLLWRTRSAPSCGLLRGYYPTLAVLSGFMGG